MIAAASGGPDGHQGPVLGIHLVGARVGELIAEGQLIYNWEALPAEVAQLIHPHPDPVRGDRRGAPRAGRETTALPLLMLRRARTGQPHQRE